ncbi:SPOR domain-containing protein [Mesorhizobium sp. ASY16-5R]|uniref:SPOR domain-containing protein n=1 Tax=Mesorhizobium sp. ASY16-5R TaxID=3445772 RepID=UPI003FA09434
MADKANLKIAAQPAISDDDPFAELTRIMGFDPRQPAKPTSIVKPARPVTVEPANDVFAETDLSLDLERELMGDFAAQEPDVEMAAPASVEPEFDEVAEIRARIAQAEAEHAAEAEAAHAATLEAPHVERVASTEPAVAQQPWFRPVEPEAAAAPVPSMHDQPDDAALSLAEAEMYAPAEPELPAAAEVELPETAQAWSAEAPIQVQPEQAEALEQFEAPVEFAAGAPEMQPEMASADAPASDWDQGRDFDAAVADYPEPVADYSEAVAPEQDAVGFDRETQARSYETAEAGPDLAGAVEFEAFEYEQAPLAAVEPALAVAPEQALEASLEHELNALLGNASQPEPAAQVRYEEPVPAYEAGHAYNAEEPAYADDAAFALSENAFDDEQAEPAMAASAPASVEALPVYDEAEQPRDDRWYDERPVDLANQHGQNQVSASVKPMAEAMDDDFDSLFDDQAFEAAINSAVAQADLGTRHSEPAARQREESENSMPRDGHDPYAALAALSADLKSGRSWQEAPAQQAEVNPYAPQTAFAGYGRAASGHGAAHAEMPDIETVDVPEQAVALADDLDLPELAYEDEPTLAPRYDDIDAEFSHLLQDMNVRGEPAPVAQHDARGAQHYPDDYFDNRPIVAAAAAAGAAAMARPAPAGDYEPVYSDAPRQAGQAARAGQEPDVGEFAYDPDFDEEIAGPAYTPIVERRRPRRGLVIAAVVGGVALLGGVAALALSFGDGTGSQELALVKADPSPVKVKPENPGGTVIPNQDSRVYDSVAGSDAPTTPTQEKLLSSAEEPVDMPTTEDEPVESPMSTMEETSDEQPAGVDTTSTAGPVVADATTPAADAQMPKGEDRVEQAAQDPGVDKSVEVAAVAPRKVRTMIVKADGTLVAREEPAPVADQVTSASEGIVDPVASTALPAGEGADTTAAVPAAAAKPAAADKNATAPRTSGTTPNVAPIAPTRPSDQPVDIVGEVKPQQVAALSPAASAGAWAMQIASQPTEAAAQSSYQDLVRRYGKVLSGKQATIAKAEIAGKGTFWRVRVPAGSRNDAIKLCESYKAAGGSCFVSK